MRTKGSAHRTHQDVTQGATFDRGVAPTQRNEVGQSRNTAPTARNTPCIARGFGGVRGELSSRCFPSRGELPREASPRERSFLAEPLCIFKGGARGSGAPSHKSGRSGVPLGLSAAGSARGRQPPRISRGGLGGRNPPSIPQSGAHRIIARINSNCPY